MNPLFGLEVQIHHHLPIVPSDGTNARRIVRHGMADILRWLGEDVGPKPDERTEVVISTDPVTGRTTLFMGREFYSRIRMEVGDGGLTATRDGLDALGVVWRVRNQWILDRPPRTLWP